MRERQTLQKLIDDGTETQDLRMGSPARHAIAALQTLLTQGPVRTYRPLAAAACKMPAPRSRRSGKRRG